MRYSTEDGKYKELVLNEHDLTVKSEVERIYKENPDVDDIQLSNKVQKYYYDEVGIGNNRLWKVVDYFCEVVTGERELIDEEEVQSVKWE